MYCLSTLEHMMRSIKEAYKAKALPYTGKKRKVRTMKCLYCAGKTEFKNASIEICVDNSIYVVKDAPLYSCKRCEEKAMTQGIASRINELITKKKAQAQIQAPVFEYS